MPRWGWLAGISPAASPGAGKRRARHHRSPCGLWASVPGHGCAGPAGAALRASVQDGSGMLMCPAFDRGRTFTPETPDPKYWLVAKRSNATTRYKT